MWERPGRLPGGDAATVGQGLRMVRKAVDDNTALARDPERLYGGTRFLAIVCHPFAV